MNKLISVKKNAEFRRAISKGEWAVGKVLSAHKYKNKCNSLRIGISVSKKIGNAVKRNTIKRRIREAYRYLIKDSNTTDVDVIIIAKSKLEYDNFTYEKIYNDMEIMLKKIGII